MKEPDNLIIYLVVGYVFLWAVCEIAWLLGAPLL